MEFSLQDRHFPPGALRVDVGVVCLRSAAVALNTYEVDISALPFIISVIHP
jgi:hypothetical protein